MTTKQLLSICAIIVIATLAIMINLRDCHEKQAIILHKTDTVLTPIDTLHSEIKDTLATGD
jgi:hypothetical protein